MIPSSKTLMRHVNAVVKGNSVLCPHTHNPASSSIPFLSLDFPINTNGSKVGEGNKLNGP